MGKPKTALFFLILANIFLLTYAVFPHHHHNEEVCFEQTHCDGDHHDSEQDKPAHHDHHKGKTPESCILEVPFIPASNSFKQDIKSSVVSYHTFDLSVFQAFFSDLVSVALKLESAKSANDAPLIIGYAQIVIPTCGLRAPPVV